MDQSPALPRPSLENQTPQLLHELEVHHGELELQNAELRSAEAELETSRDRYSLLYDFAPVGYLTLDSTGVIQQANLTAAQLLGLDRPELLGKKFALFLPVESRSAFSLHRQRIWTSQGKQTCDLRVRQPGGASFEAHLESVAMTDTLTQRRQCWITLTDITERKRAEDALRRAEARLNFVLGSNPAVIYSCRPSGDYATTFVSENVSKAFGYEAAEVLETPHFWHDHIHPEDRPGVVAKLATLATEGQQSLEYRFQHKDGSYRWLRDDARLLRDGSRRALEIVGSRIDINGRKWMEDALRQSEHSLSAFFSEAPVGLLWVTPDGRILRANRAQAAMLGYRPEELFGRQVAEFGADPDIIPAMVARLARQETLRDQLLRLRRAPALGRSSAGGSHGNGCSDPAASSCNAAPEDGRSPRPNRPDGSVVHVMIDANGMWENGRMVHSRWFVRDVTKRVELQREILGIGEGVQRRIGQDLHDDLCQQLTGIEFLSQALERRLAAKLPAEAGRAREIARLTRQAIGYTRELSHTMSPMELAAGGLGDALKNLAGRTRRLFKVDCRFQGDCNCISDDGVTRIYLYRIAQEAISNAIKHGLARRIRIGLETTADKILLNIEDNGVGLPSQLPAKSGFGLRIMDYRASSLGGSLRVEKRKSGRGTCVLCSIPKGLRHPANNSIP